MWLEKLWSVSNTDNNSNWCKAHINLVILQLIVFSADCFRTKSKNAFEVLYIQKRDQISNNTYA